MKPKPMPSVQSIRTAWLKADEIMREVACETWSWTLLAEATAVILGRNREDQAVVDHIHAVCRDWWRKTLENRS